MPIYEFYCAPCHTRFSFLARRVDPAKRPACPRCGKPHLERRVSTFAVSAGRAAEDREDAPPGDLDESRLEQALDSLAHEAEAHPGAEESPQAMARLMRKFYERTGLRLGDGIEEAIRRMEAGEDPDAIEESLGDVLEQEDQVFGSGSAALRRLRRRGRPPEVDPTLYELE